MVTIKWVYHYMDGPFNGMADYQGNPVWFSRLERPPVVSSTDVPVHTITISDDNLNERIYQLIRLDEQTLRRAQADHELYCQNTGMPLTHGEPMSTTGKPTIIRTDNSSSNKNSSLRSMITIREHQRSFNPQNIVGEEVTVVPESAFTNYNVPHKLVINRV